MHRRHRAVMGLGDLYELLGAAPVVPAHTDDRYQMQEGVIAGEGAPWRAIVERIDLRHEA